MGKMGNGKMDTFPPWRVLMKSCTFLRACMWCKVQAIEQMQLLKTISDSNLLIKHMLLHSENKNNTGFFLL
jgi:hypothetical protein